MSTSEHKILTTSQKSSAAAAVELTELTQHYKLLPDIDGVDGELVGGPVPAGQRHGAAQSSRCCRTNIFIDITVIYDSI
mgnify:CR=1 FL=1